MGIVTNEGIMKFAANHKNISNINIRDWLLKKAKATDFTIDSELLTFLSKCHNERAEAAIEALDAGMHKFTINEFKKFIDIITQRIIDTNIKTSILTRVNKMSPEKLDDLFELMRVNGF